MGVVRAPKSGKIMNTLSFEIRLYRGSRGFVLKTTFFFMTLILWFVWLLKIIILEDAIGALS